MTSSIDIQPPRGTPLSNMFQCCFPKEQNDSSKVGSTVEPKTRSPDPLTFLNLNKHGTNTSDFEDTKERDFDLPELDEEKTSDSPLSEMFKFFLGFFLLSWFSNHHQTKRLTYSKDTNKETKVA